MGDKGRLGSVVAVGSLTEEKGEGKKPASYSPSTYLSIPVLQPYPTVWGTDARAPTNT